MSDVDAWFTPPIYFKNKQWAVTGYGIEELKSGEGAYRIEADGLVKRRLGEECYDWPLHMASKRWVDVEAFLEAFDKALYVHTGRYGEPPSFHLSHRTAGRARQTAADRA